MLLIATSLLPWIHGADALGATGGLVIYKDNSFDADSLAEIASYSSVEHFGAADNVVTAEGQSLRILSGQAPIYIPAPGDPDGTPEDATRVILTAERRYPQFIRKLELVRQAWVALPKSTLAAQTPPSIAAVPLPTAEAGSAGDLHTKSGGVFQSWNATGIEGDAVIVSHADGIARIPITDLPDDLSGFPADIIDRVQQLRQQAAAAKQTQTPTATDPTAINAALAAEAGKPSSLVPGIPPDAAGANGNIVAPALSVPWPTPTPSASPAEETFAEEIADAQSEMKEHTQDGDDVRARLKDESSGKLVVKGLFLGMKFDDCYAAFQPFGKDTWYLNKGVDNLDGKEVPCLTFISQRCTMGGKILADPDTKEVTRFFFDTPLSNFLFDSDDLDASDFAQEFINSYPVPDLKPGVRYGRQLWIHDDPDGWTLLITPNKDVDVSFTKTHSFGD